MSEKPTTNDHKAWKVYWTEQREDWRTEFEIDEQRQEALRRCLAIKAEALDGTLLSVAPFQGFTLTRADIEWMLHERDEREGDKDVLSKSLITLYGAQIGNEEHTNDDPVDLSVLPLFNVDFSFTFLKPISFRNAYFSKLSLDRTTVSGDIFLESTSISREVSLFMAQVSGNIHLERALVFNDIFLFMTKVVGNISLNGTTIMGNVILYKSEILGNISFSDTATVTTTIDGEVSFWSCIVQGDIITDESNDIFITDIHNTHLETCDLTSVNLGGDATRSPADMRGAYFDSQTQLQDVILGKGRKSNRFADIHWGNANLSVLEDQWRQIEWVGDETAAHKLDDDVRKSAKDERPKNESVRLKTWKESARAYRQLATVLRAQGMNEISDRFAYRGQVAQRHVMRHEKNRRGYFGSWILEAIAGYGYKPMRTFVTYTIVVGIFAFLDYLVTNTLEVSKSVSHLSWDQSLVLSLTSFHGRGFFPGYIQLDDWIARIGAVEAIIGLFIELILIATFSRRFLGD